MATDKCQALKLSHLERILFYILIIIGRYNKCIYLCRCSAVFAVSIYGRSRSTFLKLLQYPPAPVEGQGWWACGVWFYLWL